MTNRPQRSPAPKRRWRQFSLRSLLLITLIAGAVLGAWRVYMAPFVMQQRAIEVFADLGATVRTEAGGADWLRRWVGDERMQHIVILDLGDVEDHSQYMRHVSQLPQLRMLLVGGENFTDIELRQLRGLRTLDDLVLDSTGVTDAAVAGLQDEIPRTRIRQSQRKLIHQLHPGRLDLRNSRSYHPLALFGTEHYQDILSVTFARDDIDAADLAPLLRLKYVQAVLLSDNEFIDDAALAKLSGLRTLRTLDLRRTGVTDAGMRHLKSLPKLQALLLDHTPLTDEGLATLAANNQNLVKLTFDGTQVSNDGLVHLRKLRKLEVVFLPPTITDAGLAHLHELKNLRQVWLDTANVSDSAVEQLSLAMPDCKMIR